MGDEQHDQAPDEAPTARSSTPRPYCTRPPAAGEYLSAACGTCGHAVVLHVGVEHCPVCELVDLNTTARTRVQQELQAAVRRAQHTRPFTG